MASLRYLINFVDIPSWPLGPYLVIYDAHCWPRFMKYSQNELLISSMSVVGILLILKVVQLSVL